MKFRKPVVLIGTAMALALPAQALASPSVVDQVRGHAKDARKAYKQAAEAAKDGRNQVAANHIADNVDATKEAVRSARGVVESSSDKQAAQALSALIVLEDFNVERYIRILEDLQGQVQTDVAAQIERAMAIRQQVLESLQPLLDELPAQWQAVLAGVLGDVFGDSGEEVDGIENAIDEGVNGDTEEVLTGVLDQALDLVKQTIDELSAILDVVPQSVRPVLESTLGIVSGVVDMVSDLLDDLLGGLFGGILPDFGGGLPGLGSGFFGR